MKFTMIQWYILVSMCLINRRVDSGTVTLDAGQTLANVAAVTNQNLPRQVRTTLTQIAPTENSILPQVLQTGDQVIQQLQPRYDNFNNLAQNETNHLDNVIKLLDECAWTQIKTVVSNSIFDPIKACIDANVNMVNYVLKNLHESATNQVSNFINNYVSRKAECLTLAQTTAKSNCLLQAANDLVYNTSIINNKLTSYVTQGNQMITSYQNAISLCYPNNIMSAITTLQNLGVNVKACGLQITTQLTSTYQSNDYLALALEQFNQTVNPVNILLARNVNSSLIPFQVTINAYNQALNDAQLNFQQFIDSINQCGRSQGFFNITTSTFAPIATCISGSNGMMSELISEWNTTLINTPSSTLRNLQVLKNACLILSTLSAKIDCLNTTAIAYRTSIPMIILDLKFLLLTANTTVSNFDEILGSCYTNGWESVLRAAREIGLNLSACPDLPYLPSVLDEINAALQYLNGTINQTNLLIQNSSLFNLNQLNSLVSDYLQSLGWAKENLQWLIDNITQCGRNLGITQIPMSLFASLTNCITLSDNNVQSQILLWNSTLRNTLTVLSQTVESKKNFCLTLSSTEAIVQCLYNISESYSNNLPDIIQDFKMLTTTASSILLTYKGVLNSCYSDNYNSIVTGAENIGIDVSRCSNLDTTTATTSSTTTSTIPTTPVPDNLLLQALQNFNLTVSLANLVLQNGTYLSIKIIDGMINSYNTINTSTNFNYKLFHQSLLQCAQILNIFYVPESIFDPITKCISSTDYIVQSLIPIWKYGFFNTTALTMRNVIEEKRICLMLPTTDTKITCLNYSANLYDESIPTILGVYNTTLLKDLNEINSYKEALTECFSTGYNSVLNSARRIGIDTNQCIAPPTTTPAPIRPPSNDLDLAIQSFNTAFEQANQLIHSRLNSAVEALQIISKKYMAALNDAKYNLQRFKQNIVYCARGQGYYHVPNDVFNPISNCIYSNENNARHVISSWNTTFTNKVITDRLIVLEQQTVCLASSTSISKILCLNDLARSYTYQSMNSVNYFNSALKKALDQVNAYGQVLDLCHNNGFYSVLSHARNFGINVNRCMLN